MRKPVLLLFFALIIAFAVCCHKKKDERNVYTCNTKADVIDTAENLKGTFLYDNNLGVYSIRIVAPNTIDQVTIYLICTQPQKLPAIGNEVTFSGYIRRAAVESPLVGTKYLELQVTNLE